MDNINIDELDQFDLLIVDWFLENGYSQSSDLLLKLSEKDNLPAIILLTSHENILESNTKSDFYIKTRISGAGLTILIKKEIRAESFGYIGLRMLAEKAIKQRPIANASRHYIKQWENVLESAKQNTIKSLWQLDTFIMKSIHTDAISDSQPYSNHFHDFISREHSWHMETNTTLNTYAENLGTALNEHNYNDLLTHHSNEDSITLHRELLQHYSFQGGVNTFKIHDITKDELQQKILEKLPFGAVLVHGDNSTSDSYEAFVNITQPCDLSGLIRNQPNNSLIFMTLSLKKRLVKNSMFFDTSTYHIYGLTLNDTLYDMIPKNKQLVGINFNEFYQKFNNYKLVGVLRNDITMSLQQSTAASIIRPSQPRTNRPCFGLAKLFLISCSSTGEKKCISFPNEIEFLGSTYKLDKTKNLIQIIGNNLASAAFWVCQELEFQDNSDEFNNTYRLFHESIDISKPSNISHQTTVRMLPVDSFDDHSQAIQGIQDKIHRNKNTICLTYEKFHD